MRRGVGRLAAVMIMLIALLAGCSATATDSDSEVDSASGLPYISQDQLPAEARDTLQLIDDGGPFPYDKDGATFGNREGILPDEANGFYREYTVPTPGEDDRGARRIVTGDQDTIFYYTDDHYDSFSRIRR
ncbi:ribonuclease domain-containing protein [Microlunatus soli]|uniref:Ribonuclease T1 n=1 Tax=Microlunatus soli TaxID=630515 RepID=A0A1H1PJ24_9ACTN|nr:ribonuclease domain-containing protein [Microlunatus soli]SDS11035.1 ribonuclease T1 [Microlunatus soli]